MFISSGGQVEEFVDELVYLSDWFYYFKYFDGVNIQKPPINTDERRYTYYIFRRFWCFTKTLLVFKDSSVF